MFETRRANKSLLRERSFNFTVRWQKLGYEEFEDSYKYTLQKFADKIAEDAEWQDVWLIT